MALLSEDWYKDLIILFVTILLGAIFYLKWTYSYWNRRGVITPTVSLPFGNASRVFLRKLSFGEEFKDIYLEKKPKGLPYCGYHFFIKPTLLVFDLELVKNIITRDFSHFTDHISYSNEEKDPLTGHLFALRGQRWKNLRVKLTPTFTSGKMKMMFQTLIDCSDNLVNFMDALSEREEPMEVKEVVGRFTTDIIGTCAFGIECNSLKNPNSEFRRYGKKVFEISFIDSLKRVLFQTAPQVLDFLKIPIFNPSITEFFIGVVKDTVDYRERNNIIRNDFMHLLIQLKNNVKLNDEESTGQLKSEVHAKGLGDTLTLEQMAAQAFVFFIAGFETSSTTLTFCFYELVTNPEIQERLRLEIKTVLEKHDGKLTYNSIMEMTYMDWCVNETLRKYPPVPALTRSCTQPYKIPNSDVVIDKDVQVLIPILGIQHDPVYYPEPEKFDPERFSPENKAKRHPYAWLPFGEGPRSCIGMRFGLMQTKVALAVLIGNYKFSLNSKTRYPMVLDPKSVIMAPLGGVWLNVEKISD
ncbi:hypothetical protein ILUMI_23239 [Ignelater luminosus]|uniref:Cytochrome P450 n=1 Tax=Ignelater luminosus TaxID=2038154 RepID=A0A8K0CBA3_IGNLU|nr:hypothetical protein ILUMI_23239 [Ignelater luminosus]